MSQGGRRRAGLHFLEMPTALSEDGCRIHYRLHGDWPARSTPVMLIPGWGCDSRSWGPLLQRLRARPCIALDNRDSGRSGHSRRPFGIATMADDALAVLGTLGIAEADVLGNSLGGMVGQALALRHPERVRSLVLLSSSPGIGSIPCHPILVGDAIRHLGRRIRPRSGSPEVRRRAVAAAPSSRVSLAQLGATLGWFGLPVISRIQVPTLVVHGTCDAVVPALNARIMARLIPGSALVLVPGAGHLILDTDAGPVADAISRFLERLEPGAGAPDDGPAYGAEDAGGMASVILRERWRAATPSRSAVAS